MGVQHALRPLHRSLFALLACPIRIFPWRGVLPLRRMHRRAYNFSVSPCHPFHASASLRLFFAIFGFTGHCRSHVTVEKSDVDGTTATAAGRSAKQHRSVRKLLILWQSRHSARRSGPLHVHCCTRHRVALLDSTYARQQVTGCCHYLYYHWYLHRLRMPTKQACHFKPLFMLLISFMYAFTSASVRALRACCLQTGRVTSVSGKSKLKAALSARFPSLLFAFDTRPHSSQADVVILHGGSQRRKGLGAGPLLTLQGPVNATPSQFLT
ncbi:hypothetical protein ABL78_7610 [Leptomonas seymouri]|uniref:Uncharacterized protein n=1 Tax=Leptomonas seymouri TaxID=5684 RepID=A0A0N1PAE3_LEPSE|nr:hypothetical protein ABL78_7610 [Leptomonas seymouri]|eukprot:KPI83362.1 hypothetical protein ABL78_7610 [Leptomonas seymouri]